MNDSELRLGENGKGWSRLNRRGTTQQESKSLQWPQAGQDGIVEQKREAKMSSIGNQPVTQQESNDEAPRKK